MSLESDSHLTRLEQLQAKVERSKRQLRFDEELVTHEICLNNGQIYPVKRDIVD